MAYPELVSGGGFPSHTFKWLVKVGANKGVIRVDSKKIMAGGWVSGQPENPLDTPLKKIVQSGWNGWRRMSEVICDRSVPARVKGEVYKVAVRPAMSYGLETVALTKRQEAEMEVVELKMLRFSLGVTRMDEIRNEYIRGSAQVGRFGEKTRETRLRWYGHVRRKDDGYIYWEKDAEDGIVRKEQTGKAKKDVYGCGERKRTWLRLK